MLQYDMRGHYYGGEIHLITEMYHTQGLNWDWGTVKSGGDSCGQCI